MSEGRFRCDEVEYLALGAAASDPACMATLRAMLAPGQFGLAGHRFVWEAMCGQFDAGRVVDVPTLTAAWRAGGLLAAITADVALGPLPLMPAPPERAADWGRTIAANARARAVAAALHAAAQQAGDPRVTPEAFAAATRDAVLAAADEGDVEGESWLEDEMRGVQRKLEACAQGEPQVAARTTGIERLDRMMGGLRAGQMTVLAGKTGGGKTAMALGMALSIAGLADAVPSLFVSLEMLGEDMATRALAWLTGIPGTRLRAAQTDPLDALDDELLGATDYASNAQVLARKVRLLCRGDVTVSDIRARARRMQTQGGLAAVFVDYLQLVKAAAKHGNREREVAEVSRGLKALAMDLRVPVVALSQLNRESDDRETPKLRDLRESGTLEQDASHVVFLWPLVENDEEVTGRMRVIVAKSRFGPPGEFVADFDGASTKFSSGEGYSDATE